jgi:hypothetical protein
VTRPAAVGADEGAGPEPTPDLRHARRVAEVDAVGAKRARQLGIVQGEAGDASSPATLSGASGKRAGVREHEGGDRTGRECRHQLVREGGPSVRGREQEEAGPGLLRVDKGYFGFSAHGGLKMGRIPKMSNVPVSTLGDPEAVTPLAYGGM